MSTIASKKYKFAVIGNGLIGSAACRYLSEWSDSVVVIGPGEPSSCDENDSQTVFSSHYDQGRLCKLTSQDPIWNSINGAAVRKYSTLEKRSGITFHAPVGKLSAVPRSPTERRNFLDWMEQAQKQNPSVQFQYFEAGNHSWKESFPMLDFPTECDVFSESAPSGIINPQQLIAAQNEIAKQNGATVLRELVTNVTSSSEGVCVSLANGETVDADKVLIASGAFTNFNNLLPEPIPLRYKTETTVWGTVSEETANGLRSMPAVCYDIAKANEEETPEIDDLYMAPPLLYPDGTYKIKMGSNTINESWPSTLKEIQDWFNHGNSDADLTAMTKALQGQLPKVEFIEFTSHRCIVTYTPSGYPTIDSVPGDPHGRLFVATGGNGTSAQGSDSLGHLAAGLVFDGRWSLGLPRDVFRATNAWEDTKSQKLSRAQQRAIAVEAAQQ